MMLASIIWPSPAEVLLPTGLATPCPLRNEGLLSDCLLTLGILALILFVVQVLWRSSGVCCFEMRASDTGPWRHRISPPRSPGPGNGMSGGWEAELKLLPLPGLLQALPHMDGERGSREFPRSTIIADGRMPGLSAPFLLSCLAHDMPRSRWQHSLQRRKMGAALGVPATLPYLHWTGGNRACWPFEKVHSLQR